MKVLIFLAIIFLIPFCVNRTLLKCTDKCNFSRRVCILSFNSLINPNNPNEAKNQTLLSDELCFIDYERCIFLCNRAYSSDRGSTEMR
jgi:hypothetical protein